MIIFALINYENKKSLGIFLKETGDLVQMGRNNLIETHEFYFEKK